MTTTIPYLAAAATMAAAESREPLALAKLPFTAFSSRVVQVGGSQQLMAWASNESAQLLPGQFMSSGSMLLAL